MSSINEKQVRKHGTGTVKDGEQDSQQILRLHEEKRANEFSVYEKKPFVSKAEEHHKLTNLSDHERGNQEIPSHRNQQEKSHRLCFL